MVTFYTTALYQTTHTTTLWTVTTMKTWKVILIFVTIRNCTSRNLMREGTTFTLILRWSPSQPSIFWGGGTLCSTCLTSRSIMRWILSDFSADESGNWCCHLIAAHANNFFSCPIHMGGMEVWLHSFITLAIVKYEWSASCPSCSILWKEPWYPYWIGGWGFVQFPKCCLILRRKLFANVQCSDCFS